MPEFIFRTSHFNETGRFIKFDLAYRSDNATVLVCAEEKGIFSIEKAKVLWRDSGVNISSTYNISTQKRGILYQQKPNIPINSKRKAPTNYYGNILSIAQLPP